MAEILGDILKQIDWQDGFKIPIADDENNALEKELMILQERKCRSKNALDIVNGRIDALKDHFKFVSQESEQTQKLITAHKQQLDFIQDQYHVYKAENENIERFYKSTIKQLKESESKQEIKKVNLQKHIIKADQLQNEMDWDSKALKAWEETLKKRDEDNDLIQKFSKEDDMRFNLLEAKRQHLQEFLTEMRMKAAKISSSAHNCELILERSGKVMKQLFVERENLTFQWKEAINMMKQRDDDVVNIQDQIVTTLEIIQKEEEKLNEENTFLKNENRNNHELEQELEKCNAVNSSMRKELNELTQHMLFLNTELQTLKREVSTSSLQLQNERVKSKTLTQLIEEKTMCCAQYQEDMNKINNKMAELEGSTLTSNERIKRIENMIEKEEKYYAVCVTDTEKINSTLYRLENLLLEQKELGKSLELDITNSTSNCTQLRRHIRQLKKDLDKIKEVVYDMEFRIEDIEKKLYKIDESAKADENTEEKDNKIVELEKMLSYHKDVQHALQNQVDKLQEEMHRLTNIIATEKELLVGTQSKCENLMMFYEIGQKQIATAKKLTQERQVEENIMLLRVNQIEKDKKLEERNIFSLEKLRLNLDQAMKERQIEINTKKSIVQAKRRNLEEDRGRLKADISIRRLKIEQLKKKYHIVLTSLGQNEEGEHTSITHFRIKNAQEKFLLQQEGDELDQKIKTAEKEIVAMENALKLVNLSNYAFRNSIAIVKDNDEEVEEMKLVDQELEKLNTELKNHKTLLKEKDKELKELEFDLSSVEKILNEFQEKVIQLEEESQLVKRQEYEKEEKLARANCTVKKLLKNLERQKIENYERDFEIRQLRDLNKNVQKSLMLMCSTYPEITETVTEVTYDLNVAFPPGYLTPSTSGTSQSSLSSCTIDSDDKSSKYSTVNIQFNNQ